jgi:hypothetical protein
LNPEVALIEQTQYKRRWGVGDAQEEAREAVGDWALTRIEASFANEVASVRQITAAWARVEATRVAEAGAYLGPDLALWTRQQLGANHVPFLAAYRHTDAGLEKRAAWERTWDLQRREDAGENVGEIPVPPKYDQKDFRDPNYFRLRGKLDVPKERFISYPGCESDEDGEPVYGWAGWNHLERAQALAALYQDRKTREGWPKERLLPMLAGLLELIPWVKQWHNDPSADFDGLRLGDYFEGFLRSECAEHGFTEQALREWRPEAKTRAKATKRAARKLAEEEAT